MKPSERTADVPPVRVVAWEVTRACNLACPYCRASAGRRDTGELSTVQARAALDQIALLGRPLVILSGGEPLLRDDIFEIAGRASQSGFPTALASNGTLISPEAARRLAAAGVRRVSVSLDSADAAAHDGIRGGGSFDAAMGGIANLRGAGLPFQINMTVSRANAAEVSPLHKLAVNLGADAFHLFFVVEVGRAKVSRAGLAPAQYEGKLTEIAGIERDSRIHVKVTCAPQYRRIRQSLGLTASPGRADSPGCMAGRGFLFISAVGEIRPCGYFDRSVGIVGAAPLDRLWAQHPLFTALRDRATFGGRCGICKYAEICGGCRARALAATGDFAGEDPACAYNS